MTESRRGVWCPDRGWNRWLFGRWRLRGGGGGTAGETVVDESITEEQTWNVELESGQTMTVNLDTSEGLARLQVQRSEGADGDRELDDLTSRDSIEFTHTAEMSGEFVVNVQPSGTIGVQVSVA